MGLNVNNGDSQKFINFIDCSFLSEYWYYLMYNCAFLRQNFLYSWRSYWVLKRYLVHCLSGQWHYLIWISFGALLFA